MESKRDLENTISSLRTTYIHLDNVLDEIWSYHPANPDFINPIRVYDELVGKMVELERKISKLELQLNSLN